MKYLETISILQLLTQIHTYIRGTCVENFCGKSEYFCNNGMFAGTYCHNEYIMPILWTSVFFMCIPKVMFKLKINFARIEYLECYRLKTKFVIEYNSEKCKFPVKYKSSPPNTQPYQYTHTQTQ